MSITLFSIIGEPFYAKRVPDAQRTAQAYAVNGGLVVSMPIIAQGFPYVNWLTANSEDHSGIDKDGVFVPKGSHVVVTIHGGKEGWGLLTPEITDLALDMHKRKQGGLNNVYAVKLQDVYNKDVFTDLLHGGMPDGSSIPILSYEQFKRDGAPQGFARYAVVRPLELARQTDSGYNPFARLVNVNADGSIKEVTDSQVIVYVGGATKAKQFLEKVKQHYKSENYGVRHPFNLKEFNPDEEQGRLLFLGDNDYDGLYGSSNLNYFGRFLGVAEKELRKLQALESLVQKI